MGRPSEGCAAGADRRLPGRGDGGRRDPGDRRSRGGWSARPPRGCRCPRPRRLGHPGGTASAGCVEEAGETGQGVRPGRDGPGAGAALRGDPRGKGVSRLVMMAVAVFLVGACIGSFLNVVIHRLPRGESIVSPRSRCPGCGRAIRVWENIPVASFIVLGGKCAWCGGAISWRYPAVELLTATGFAAILLLDGQGIPLLRDLLFFSLLVPIAFIDIDHRIIPDELS